MSKDKIYFPISENYEDFVALANSKDGLVIPIIYNKENKFHITAYTKEVEDGAFFDIHVKNQDTNEYYSIFRATITKEQLENFAKKCESLAFEIYPIISKYFIKSEDVNKNELFCIDCSYSIKALPSKLNVAKEFWKSLSEIKEEDVLFAQGCDNPKHKTFFDKENNRLLHKINDNIFLLQNDTDFIFNELDKIYLKYFSEELKVFEVIINDVTKVINQEDVQNE